MTIEKFTQAQNIQNEIDYLKGTGFAIRPTYKKDINTLWGLEVKINGYTMSFDLDEAENNELKQIIHDYLCKKEDSIKDRIIELEKLFEEL